ncbi:MAG: hypothetical protein ACLSH6_08315 [Limosilactobacillus pontis]
MNIVADDIGHVGRRNLIGGVVIQDHHLTITLVLGPSSIGSGLPSAGYR